MTPERPISEDELNFRANADVEDAREAGKARKRQHRRADKKHDTTIHRVARKLAPPGSKRRTAAAGLGVTAVLAPAAYGTVRAIDAGTDAAARGAYEVGRSLDGGSDTAGAPYGEGVDVSLDDVTAAQEREAAEKRLSDAAAEHEADSGN